MTAEGLRRQTFDRSGRVWPSLIGLARAVAAIKASGGSMPVPAALSVLWIVR
jgi:hypothetical protein